MKEQDRLAYEILKSKAKMMADHYVRFSEVSKEIEFLKLDFDHKLSDLKNKMEDRISKNDVNSNE